MHSGLNLFVIKIPIHLTAAFQSSHSLEVVTSGGYSSTIGYITH